MAYLEWTKDLSVENKILDEHHKKLFCLINRLHDAINKGTDCTEVDTTLAELAQYTRYHFTEEERQMALTGFIGLEAHKREHKAFISQLEGFIVRLDAGSKTLSIGVLRFLSNWITSHILKTDKAYIAILIDKSA